MSGKGTISPATTPGTLDHVTANDPSGAYSFLKSGASYAVRDDVWIRDQNGKKGGLTTGYGTNAGLIGPELGFGHQIGEVYESQVLIVKCGVDGTTLAHSFCPPSSRVGAPEPVTSADRGFYYKEVLRLVNEATTNLGSYFQDYDGGGWEIAGFGWHQGWNDRVNAAYSPAYRTNMVNFINDIRLDLGVPDLPFVIASAGMDGLDGYGYTEVEKAQLKMADPVSYPAFAGNVAVVDTRVPYGDLPFWQGISQSPADEGYHWNRSGRTYLHIGLAMGDAMSLLAPDRIPFRPRATGGSGGVTLTWRNGTETPASVRVLRNGVEIAPAAPANPPAFLDAGAPLGRNEYELRFAMPASPCPPLRVALDTGITRLAGHLRADGLRLTWTNHLAYAGIRVKRNGVVIADALPGDATRFTDTWPPAGPVTYSVEPHDAGGVPAEITLTVSAAPRGEALIYEPFDMAAGTSLNEKEGGVGLDRNWSAGTAVQVTSAGLYTFGALPMHGNRIVRTTSNGTCSINTGDILGEAGLLADGARLWFSFLTQNPNNINVHPTLVLGDEIANFHNTTANQGSAIGAKLNQGNKVQGIVLKNGVQAAVTATQATLAAGEVVLVVGRITWGANAAAADVIDVYSPGPDLVLDTPQSASAVVDQSGFRVLSMWGNGVAPNMDEIRFGPTFASVTGPGPLDHFDIAPIPSPQTVGTPITGISITALDSAGRVVNRFNGTAHFGGSAGCTGPTGIFAGGTLTGAAATPAVAGDNLTLTVDDGGGKTGSTVIDTVRTRFAGWSGGAPFAGDANGDEVADGLAWLLGAVEPSASAVALMPEPDEQVGRLVMKFRARNSAVRDGVALKLQFSNDLGRTDPWEAHEVAVPDANGIVDGITFEISPTADPAMIDVRAVLPADAATAKGTLYGRLIAVP